MTHAQALQEVVALRAELDEARAQLARERSRRRATEEDEARAIDDWHNAIHAARNAALAAKAYKQHRDVLMQRLGQAQRCAHGERTEVAA